MPTSLDLTIRLHSDIRAAGVNIDGISGVVSPYDHTTVVVSPRNLQSLAQPTIDAFDGSDTAQTAWQDAQNQSASIDYMSVTIPLGKSLRAVAAIMVDEINALRDWITAFDAAVAAATSLADLKTRVAALPAMPDRTLAQAKTAFINKIQGGV